MNAEVPPKSPAAAIGARLKAFEQAEVERVLAACTQCGKCFEVCPMTRYAKAAAGADSKSVVAGVLAVLREQKGTPEALGWISVCARSGACVPACPEKVDPRMMLRLARMTALGGRGHAKQIEAKDDPDFFDRMRAFAKLSFSDDEIKDWM